MGSSNLRSGKYLTSRYLGRAGDGCGRAVPHHLLGEPVLPDGGMLLLELARVLPHPGPESHDGCPEVGVRDCSAEVGVRDCSALWGISVAA